MLQQYFKMKDFFVHTKKERDRTQEKKFKKCGSLKSTILYG